MTFCVCFLQLLLGQRYGYRPIPSTISVEEFQLIRRHVAEHKGNVELLDKWYKEDLNAEPHVYTLQQISMHFPNFVAKVGSY